MPPINHRLAEHYPWGEADACDAWFLVKSPERTVLQEQMPPGATEARHYHERAWQFFFILAGEATFELAGQDHTLQPQDGIEVPPGTPHRIRNLAQEPLHFLVISMPHAHGDRITLDAEA